MNKRVLDVLTYVMKEISDNTFEDIDLQLILDVLEEHGFTEEEISSAMTWLMSHGAGIDQVYNNKVTGVPRPIWRQLHEEEKEYISTESFSYLIKLRELGFLTDDQVEKIIDQAVGMQISAMSLDDMQDLIAAVVLDFENNAMNGYFQFSSPLKSH